MCAYIYIYIYIYIIAVDQSIRQPFVKPCADGALASLAQLC